MKIVEHSYDKDLVVALGLFDSVHRGHARLISEAHRLSEFFGVELGVFTFRNNPFKYFNKDIGMVYTFEERAKIMESIGVDVLIGKTMDYDYAKTSPEDFLESLFTNFNIKGVVCGLDFSFGNKGNGDVELLKAYAASRGAVVKQVPYLCTEDGDKISSSLIRKYISEGRIRWANQLIGRPYMISGDVVHCFGRGRDFGFPTANIFVPEEKTQMLEGVYATTVEVDGYIYNSLTNIGSKPTFNDYSLTVESFLVNYKGNLYNKHITVYFYSKIRDIKKFANEREIHDQIEKDIEVASMIKRTL